VLDPTIAGMTVTKVLIDGGARLNIIFLEILKKMGLDFAGLITPTGIPFYGIVHGKAAMLLGQITLRVMFGTQANYRTKFIQFEVVNFVWQNLLNNMAHMHMLLSQRPLTTMHVYHKN
jgi:hypothetical protein